MLSERELKELRRKAEKFEFPMVESDILLELLDFYEGRSTPKKNDQSKQKKIVIAENRRVD